MSKWKMILNPVFLNSLIFMLGLAFHSIGPFNAAAQGVKVIKEDTDKDGRIDRIAHLDPTGNLVKLEADRDGDGRMDTFQYYEKGVLMRVEKDSDADGNVDEKDILEKGKRTLHEKLDTLGRPVGAIRFDEQERPLRWERDTTGDGRFDTIHHYENGALTLVTKDTTGGGKANFWQKFKDEKPVEQKADRDGDGRLEQVVYYDQEGAVARTLNDTDKDGFMETLRLYVNGEISRQEKRRNGSDAPFHVVEYRDSLPVKEMRDTNLDGSFDTELKLVKGRPVHKKEDTDHDGKPDRFTDFDEDGRPALIREKNRISRFMKGIMTSLEQVEDGKKTVTTFEKEKPVLQTVDQDDDGRIEQRITFDKAGIILLAETDSNRDGRMDTWQHYKSGDMVKAEQDRNHDGRIDSVMEYDKGRMIRVLLDRDGDGHFETRQILNEPGWTMVTEVDTDGDGKFDERYRYIKDAMRVKEVFSGVRDRWVSIEEYNGKGRLVISRESSDGKAGYDLTWHYDAEERAFLGEKDSDGDGRTDTWFYYEKGRLSMVEEDRNQDGRPDLWEHYDESEAMTSRMEDLDFDGKADIEKKM